MQLKLEDVDYIRSAGSHDDVDSAWEEKEKRGKGKRRGVGRRKGKGLSQGETLQC